MGAGGILLIMSSCSLLLYTITQGAYNLWFKTLPQYLLQDIELYDTYKWLACSCAKVLAFLPIMGAILVSIAQALWEVKKVWDMRAHMTVDKDCLILALQTQNDQLLEKLKKIGEEFNVDLTDVLQTKTMPRPQKDNNAPEVQPGQTHNLSNANIAN